MLARTLDATKYRQKAQQAGTSFSPFHPDCQTHPIARTEISRGHILADSTIDETVQRGNFMHTCNRMQICLVQSDKEPVHLVLSRVGRDADPNSTPKSRTFQYCAGNLE
jgi:hypothetical protein